MFSTTGSEMDHVLLKSGFKSGVLCLTAATFLVGCGLKPSLNDLKVPDKSNNAALEKPTVAETIDGQADGQEPISKSKEKRGFLLDFLL